MSSDIETRADLLIIVKDFYDLLFQSDELKHFFHRAVPLSMRAKYSVIFYTISTGRKHGTDWTEKTTALFSPLLFQGLFALRRTVYSSDV